MTYNLIFCMGYLIALAILTASLSVLKYPKFSPNRNESKTLDMVANEYIAAVNLSYGARSILALAIALVMVITANI